MNDVLTSFLFVAATLGTVYAIGKAADDSTRPDVKAALSAWLRNTNLAQDHTKTIHQTLLMAFNGVFDREPLTVRFIRQSIKLSFFGSFTVLALVYLTLKLLDNREASRAAEALEQPFNFLVRGLALFAAAIVIDYISLAKTAIIANSDGYLRSPFRYYALDLAVSLVAACGWGTVLILGSVATGWIRGKTLGEIGSSTEVFSLLSAITALVPTLFTLTLCLAVGFSKIILLIGKPLQSVKSRVLDIDGRPFSAVALLSWPVFAAIALVFVFLIS